MPTAFNRRLGETQGRVEPVGANALDGSFVFALGSDVSGSKYPINLGDSVRVEQTADVTGIKLIRFQAILRPPASLPAGTRWIAEWGVGHIVHGRRELPATEPVHLRDGAINVSAMSGNKTIFFRLRFVGTGPIVDLVSITPAGGTPLGGSPVTIKGWNLTGATDGDLDGLPLTSFVVVDDETITAVTPAHDLGLVNVRVSHPNGDAWLVNGYRYKLLIPEDRYMELMFVSSPESTALTSPGEVIGSRNIDVSILPIETKHWFFVATLLSEDVGNHSYVELWDVTHNVMVATAVLNNSGAPDVTQAYTVVSAELTEGTSAGDIRTDVACEYEVRLRRVNGIAGQYVTCTNAHIRIVFDG